MCMPLRNPRVPLHYFSPSSLTWCQKIMGLERGGDTKRGAHISADPPFSELRYGSYRLFDSGIFSPLLPAAYIMLALRASDLPGSAGQSINSRFVAVRDPGPGNLLREEDQLLLHRLLRGRVCRLSLRVVLLVYNSFRGSELTRDRHASRRGIAHPPFGKAQQERGGEVPLNLIHHRS